jgi:hypothetical protein
MGRAVKGQVVAESVAELEARDQEVLRANRELAAYFKGRRTEREARAALKIIKAFVRDRERTVSSRRRPLPGASSARKAKRDNAHTTAASRRRRKRGATPKANRSTHEADQVASASNGSHSSEEIN